MVRQQVAAVGWRAEESRGHEGSLKPQDTGRNMLERRQAGKRARAGRGVQQACPSGGPGRASLGDPEEWTAGGEGERVPGDTRSETSVSNEAPVPEPSVRKHRGVSDQHGQVEEGSQSG